MTRGSSGGAKREADSSGELTIVNSPGRQSWHMRRPQARDGEVLWVIWYSASGRRELWSNPRMEPCRMVMLIEFTPERPKKRRPLTGSGGWKSASGLSGLRGCRPYQVCDFFIHL